MGWSFGCMEETSSGQGRWVIGSRVLASSGGWSGGAAFEIKVQGHGAGSALWYSLCFLAGSGCKKKPVQAIHLISKLCCYLHLILTLLDFTV